MRLTGLAVDIPDGRCDWPWGDKGPLISAEPRGRGPASSFPLTYSYLLGESTAKALQAELGALTVFSCRSGLVWLQGGGGANRP